MLILHLVSCFYGQIFLGLHYVIFEEVRKYPSNLEIKIPNLFLVFLFNFKKNCFILLNIENKYSKHDK